MQRRNVIDEIQSAPDVTSQSRNKKYRRTGFTAVVFDINYSFRNNLVIITVNELKSDEGYLRRFVHVFHQSIQDTRYIFVIDGSLL